MALFAEQVPGSAFGRIPGVGTTGGVPPRYVLFQPDPPSVFGVTAQLTADVAVPNAGDGNVERQEIPRRTARTVWKGRAPITLQVPILLDGWARRLSMEASIRNLDAMMGRGRAGTPTGPLDLIIDASGWVPYDQRTQPDLRWWIEGIEWSDSVDDVIRRDDGHRVRQAAVVQLVQVVRGPVALRASSGARARDQLRRDTQLTYTVRSGESLRDVARKFYGQTSRWEDIARLNNLSHPTVAAGRTLRLPS